MVSPKNYVIAYDYETGGLDSNVNPPTEVALVAINVKTLEIIDSYSAVFLPRMDLSFIEDNIKKEAGRLFKELSKIDEVTNLKRLAYKDQLLTPRTFNELTPDIEAFRDYLENTRKSFVIEYDDYLKLLETEYAEIARLYFELSYQEGALTVTHMSIDLLLKEGRPAKEIYTEMLEFIAKYTNGVHKPVIAGQNIFEFDNGFLEKGFQIIGIDIWTKLNKFMFDTLVMAHLKWDELPYYNLGTIAMTLGLTLKEAHRALPDTEATAKVVIAMLRALKGEGGGETEYTRKKYNFNF